jgi:hypothetical protein
MDSSQSTPGKVHDWSKEAFALALQARSLPGGNLEQVALRLQRHSGRTREACWRFIIQHGLKNKGEHRRWTEAEIELLREELVKRSVDEVARKLKRTPQAIRSLLRRMHLGVKEIRCDRFSVESLSAALHVGRTEVLFWISTGWLPATVSEQGGRKAYVITPEALAHLYKKHHLDVLKRGAANHLLFEAYVQYCFVPKHTSGEQLLNVRRDKREREAFEAHQAGFQTTVQGEDEEDDPSDGRYAILR